VCLAWLLSVPAGAEEPLRPVVPGEDTFSRSALLDRFDDNSDGKLGAAERMEIRAAFGGIDVPILPTRPYRYTNVDAPSYLEDSELRRMDNTSKSNLLTDAGAALGRVLFYDTQLSANNTIACGSCHFQKHAFADPRQFSVGFEGRRTGRNAMGLVNLRFSNLKNNQPGFF